MCSMRLPFVLLLSAAVGWTAEPLQVGGNFREELEDYLTSLANQQIAARTKKVEAITTPAGVRSRQEFVRNWMHDAIGGLPEKTPLNPRITGTLERDGYRVEKLIFESLPKFYVTANVYVPAGRVAPFPALVGVAGHSDSGKAIDTYQHVWISFAKLGFLVLAFDPPGQGERLEYFDPALGKSAVGVGTREHMMAGLQCLLTGTTFARYEINDGVRAVDYLLTRDDVDPKRIGVAGNSGGGTQAAYLAALEPRLAAAVTSCYITSWQTLWAGPGPQDSEQVLPNFLHDGLDFGDFLLAFAPKPIEMTTAIQDFFPIAGARATFAEAERLFRIDDAPGRVGYFEYDDKHGWTLPRREAAYSWFSKWLQGKDGHVAEPAHTAEPAADLNVTKTGQVSTSLGGETVQSLNRALAEKQFGSRLALRATPEELRRMITGRLRVSREAGAVNAVSAGEMKQGEYVVEKLRIATEGNTEIPALLFRAADEQTCKKAVIRVDSAGKAAAPDRITELLKGGECVLAIDPRGVGENGGQGSSNSGYTGEYQLAMRALLVGKTMLGMQVTDALQSFRWLRSRKDIDPAGIRMEGAGSGSAVAVLAAALEPRIAGVTLDGPLRSWMEIARSRVHSAPAGVFVPGVLRDFDLPDAARLIAPRAVTARGAAK